MNMTLILSSGEKRKFHFILFHLYATFAILLWFHYALQFQRCLKQSKVITCTDPEVGQWVLIAPPPEKLQK